MKKNNQLKIASIQADLVWENPSENRKRFQEKITKIKEFVDVIVLPEMFTTGFTMNVLKCAEKMDGTTVLWMQNLAKETQAAIVGSIIIIIEDKNYYNRLLFVHPSGEIDSYDKRHLFTLVGEEKVFTAGKNQKIVNYKGWKICPLICYDLRFPVWARNTQNYDVLLYVANWPKPRITAWDTLLKARAIENMSYVIGVNRIGKDAKENAYTGNSSVYNCLGKELCKIIEKESVTIISLDKNYQQKIRNKFNFLADKDDSILT